MSVPNAARYLAADTHAVVGQRVARRGSAGARRHLMWDLDLSQFSRPKRVTIYRSVDGPCKGSSVRCNV